MFFSHNGKIYNLLTCLHISRQPTARIRIDYPREIQWLYFNDVEERDVAMKVIESRMSAFNVYTMEG